MQARFGAGRVRARFTVNYMERDALELPVDDDVDPRRLRSRTRLLDAATKLLSAGGIEAVTIDEMGRASCRERV